MSPDQQQKSKEKEDEEEVHIVHDKRTEQLWQQCNPFAFSQDHL